MDDILEGWTGRVTRLQTFGKFRRVRVGPVRVLPPKPLEQILRDAIDERRVVRWEKPARIRVTEMAPFDSVILSPYGRGEFEALVHPDTWGAIVKPYREYMEAAPQLYERVLAPEELLSPDLIGHYTGTPVVDDTIKARMEREARG